MNKRITFSSISDEAEIHAFGIVIKRFRTSKIHVCIAKDIGNSAFRVFRA